MNPQSPPQIVKMVAGTMAPPAKPQDPYEMAVGALFAAHARDADRAAQAVLGRCPEVADVVIETFVRIWRRRAKIPWPLQTPSAWVYRVAQRVALEFVRSRQKQRRREVHAEVEGAAEPSAEARVMLGEVDARLTDEDRELIETLFRDEAQTLLVKLKLRAMRKRLARFFDLRGTP